MLILKVVFPLEDVFLNFLRSVGNSFLLPEDYNLHGDFQGRDILVTPRDLIILGILHSRIIFYP